MTHTDEIVILLTTLLDFATPDEARGLRQILAGNVHPEDLPAAVAKATRAIVGYKGRLLPRPAGARAASDYQRDVIRAQAKAAGVAT